MFPNLDPKKMQAVMKQMGISQEEIPCSRVIIEKTDNTKIIIDEPSVTRVKMNGQETFQISGEIHEEQNSFSEQDIKTIIEKTNASEEEAKHALEETGDLAEAIMKLSNI
ncbi:MAG: nascent polypeptide-associated complex protein [Nanoarchaeota archaeon]|nr:nascent polypeptide-associated complex protein [Nanoarchaeota archaeon]